MKALLSVTLLVVLVLISISCGKGKSPVEPNLDRQVEYFAYPTALFDPNDDDLIENPGGFHEVDMARILCGWNTASPEEVFIGTDYTTAVVTLQRGPSPDDPFKPVIRFLQGNENGDPSTGTFSDVYWVTGWDDDSDGEHPAEYRHPKCDAIVVQTSVYTAVIEIAVVYQVRGLLDNDVISMLGDDFHNSLYDETNDGEGDWDIGVSILRWDSDDFPDVEPTRTDFLIPDARYEAQYQAPDTDPDVAYDRLTGDCYIVYSKGETDTPYAGTKIKYVILNRDQSSSPYPLLTTTIFGGNGWNIGWPRLVQMTSGHNGHTPSIAIGLLDFFIYDGEGPEYHWIEDMRWVCIAYTSQYDNHNGYHVIAGGWQLGVAGGYNNRYFFAVRHPDDDYEWLDAGFPCIALTPSANCTRNFAALVLTQQVGSDGYGPEVDVYEVDLFGVGNLLSTTEWHRIPPPTNYADCLYPSIALNDNDSGSGPFYASVTYMAQDPNNDVLYPAVSKLSIQLSVHDTEPHLTAARTDSLTNTIENAGEITGNYNMSQIPFIDPGVATTIVHDEVGRYWAAWNERIEMEPPPAYVYGTYGWIGD